MNAKTIDDQFVEHMSAAMVDFGAARGELKFYEEHWPEAMRQLQEHGCEHCAKKKCKRCRQQDGWQWNASGQSADATP